VATDRRDDGACVVEDRPRQRQTVEDARRLAVEFVDSFIQQRIEFVPVC